MIRLILINIVLIYNLFAIDAKMEIIKKQTSLPVVYINTSIDIDETTTNKISQMLIRDLQVSGHFSTKHIDYNINYNSIPNFVTLKNNEIDIFVNLSLSESDSNKITLRIKVFDVNSKKMMLDTEISNTSKVRYPFLAHRAAILINNQFNAPSIDWMKKYVIFSKYVSAGESQIILSDYTLTYQRIMIKGGLNIFPKWANDKQTSFYYSTFDIEQMPVLMKKDVYSKRLERVLSSHGMIISSDVSEDGTKLLLTMGPNSQADIYIYDTINKINKRLTYYKGIDVGANFVENDTKIVFVSDRLSRPNIFSKKIGSDNIERLVYHGKSNSSSTTHNNKIVYTSREASDLIGSNDFNLYLIATDNDFIKQLTTRGINQFPKFSSDGETILYIKRDGGKSSLNLIRLKYNKNFSFPLKSGKLQSIDW